MSRILSKQEEQFFMFKNSEVGEKHTYRQAIEYIENKIVTSNKSNPIVSDRRVKLLKHLKMFRTLEITQDSSEPHLTNGRDYILDGAAEFNRPAVCNIYITYGKYWEPEAPEAVSDPDFIFNGREIWE